ncbi:hypothetical protein D3C80_1650360 [compost metagenome]
MFEDVIILRRLDQGHALLAKQAGGIGRVGTARLHVDEQQVLPLLLERGPHILRLAGVGVEIAPRQHAAYLVVRVHLVRNLGRQGARHQLVVSRLVFDLLPVFPFLKHQPGAGEGAVQHDVDLVEGEPVLHQTIELLEAGARVAGEKVHHLAIAP